MIKAITGKGRAINRNMSRQLQKLERYPTSGDNTRITVARPAKNRLMIPARFSSGISLPTKEVVMGSTIALATPCIAKEMRRRKNVGDK